MYREIFFTNILNLLQQRKLTKQDLARLSGVSVSFLSDLTNGKGNPSLDIMAKIADGLGVPLDWLLTTHDLGELADAAGRPNIRPYGLPEGFEDVFARLPKVFAIKVREWNSYYQTEADKGKAKAKKKKKPPLP